MKYLIQYKSRFGFCAEIGDESAVYNLMFNHTCNPDLYSNIAVYRLIDGKNPECMECVFMAKFDRIYIYDKHKNYIGCYGGLYAQEN